MSDSVPVGIDLGTTYSCICVYKNNKYDMVPMITTGRRTMPSFVSFDKDVRLIGDAAKKKLRKNARNTVYDAKRLIGRKFDDPKIQANVEKWSFEVGLDDEDEDSEDPVIFVDFESRRQKFSPQEISAMVLRELKDSAEKYLGQEIEDAVITVPAYFDDSQRKATEAAGEIAGLRVIQMINEPTAASIAFGVQKGKVASRDVLVYDLGGGTFDVSYLQIRDGYFDVLGSDGDGYLGGQDFDECIFNYCLEEYQKEFGDHKNDLKGLAELRSKVEAAKIELSVDMQATIEFKLNREECEVNITRAKFEQLCDNLFKRTFIHVERCFEKAGKTKADVTDIVLVGGSTHIPKIKELVSQYFDGKRINQEVHPDEAVAIGACIQHAMQIGIDNDDLDEIMVVDRTTHKYGLNTVGDVFEEMIDHSTVLPHTVKKVFETVSNNQTTVTIEIMQKKNDNDDDSSLVTVDVFDFEGLEPKPAGASKIEVTFHIDKNSVLNVSVKDLGNPANTKNISIKTKNLDEKALSKEQMKIKFAKMDAAQKKRVKLEMELNELESAVNKAERKIESSTDKAAKDEMRNVIDRVNGAIEAKKANNELTYAFVKKCVREVRDEAEVLL